MTMRTLEEQIGGKCKHFTGISNAACAVGIRYADVRDESSRPYKFPCLKRDGLSCPSQEFPTEAEVAAEVAEIRKAMDRTDKAMRTAKADAESRGLRRGNGGTGSVKCPACESGELSYSVSGYNGHMHAACSTDNCVRWME